VSTGGIATGGLSEVNRRYADRTRRAKELQEAGAQIFGYYCCYPPLEMLTALDIVPYRIGGDVREPITEADAVLETITCPFIRSSFDLALKGRYNFLDGLIVPHSCDTVQRIYEPWKEYNKPGFTFFVNVPHMLHPASFVFFKRELQRLRKALEEHAGRPISDERLREAITLHNQARSLLRELYDLRRSSPPLIAGSEVTEVLMVGHSTPVAEFIGLLTSVVEEVKRRPQKPVADGPRIMLWGSEMDDVAFVKLVEECGASVVVDDMCTGTRIFWHDVPQTPDPLDGLVTRYLDKIPCPRTYRQRSGTRREDLESRFSHLRDFIQQFGVDGLIFFLIRYCDTHELEAPDVREYLEAMGIPTLFLVDDYSVNTIGQLRTRVQAFVEMII